MRHQPKLCLHHKFNQAGRWSVVQSVDLGSSLSIIHPKSYLLPSTEYLNASVALRKHVGGCVLFTDVMLQDLQECDRRAC